MQIPTFTIIIPIYNREDYLERSAYSVINQSYNDWELILVDDGSMDNSLAVCKEIACLNPNRRIKVVHQENMGPGAARNTGLNCATGEYVLFLDSDDWFEEDCLELCANCVRECSPDLISFFMKEIYGNEIKINKRSLIPDGLVDNKKKNFLMSRDISIGTRACRRELIEKYNIRFPHWPTSEDVGFMLLCYATASSVCQIKKALYNYDKCTVVSATKYGSNGMDYLFSIPYDIKDRFQRIKKYEQYEKILAKMFLTDVKYSIYLSRNNIEQIEKTKKTYKEICKNLYPTFYDTVSAKYLVLGSYSLRSAVQSFALDINEVNHYQFQSLISVMQGPKCITFDSPSEYRKMMINKTLSGNFLSDIKDADYIIIDFLEERFDMCIYDDYWITYSDAWQEGKSKDRGKIVMSKYSLEVLDRFTKTCEELVDILISVRKKNRVILVKNYLMEYQGEWGPERQFNNISEIKRINRKLEKCYQIFEEMLPNVTTLEPYSEIRGFSDESYRHGCESCHTCESIESYIGEKIVRIVDKDIESRSS